VSGPLALAAAVALAVRCAPGVAPETLLSVARTESQLDPYAIHENASGESFHPESLTTAIAIAKALIERGRSVDLGLMQINNANLAPLGLSIADAFDACKSMQASAEVLQTDYRAALRDALSRYNTGDPDRGIANGYVARVETSAVTVVPAISGTVRAVPSPATPGASRAPATPGWDIFASSGGQQFVSANSNSQVQP
jgi:type IV secretion system protein VirB1